MYCISVNTGTVTHLHLPGSLHSLGTGSRPLQRGGTLDTKPRPHAPAIKADRLVVLSVRSRGRPPLSFWPSPAPLGCYW